MQSIHTFPASTASSMYLRALICIMIGCFGLYLYPVEFLSSEPFSLLWWHLLASCIGAIAMVTIGGIFLFRDVRSYCLAFCYFVYFVCVQFVGQALSYPETGIMGYVFALTNSLLPAIVIGLFCFYLFHKNDEDVFDGELGLSILKSADTDTR